MRDPIRAMMVAAVLVPAGLAGQNRFELPAERDWGAALRGDAQALHDEVATNHPGPVNPADPGFARRNDAQLARALTRAETAHSYEDYFFALREYVASFNDGHFSFGSFGKVATPAARMAWPGFLTSYDGQGVQRIVVRADDAPVALGARLVGCDGRSAERVGADVLGLQWGRWQLASQRENWGNLLFSDWGDPYVRRPIRCTFDQDGHRRTVTLAWQAITAKDLSAHEREARRPISYTFAARTLADGTRWYAMPSFNGDPRSDAGKALPPIIAAMRADRAALAAAPAIVLDLRGNGGGTSDWSYQIAKLLWGEAAVERRPQPTMHVDWRVSPANLQTIEDGYAQRGTADLSAESRHWFESVIAGLKGALTRNAALWRDDNGAATDAPAKPPAASAPPPLRGPIYLLTDSKCGSACLDAVDLWRSLGAIHVGRTTSADTLYMEVRRYRLPSGLSGGNMPMKVYRGRPRGANEPVVPARRFAGDITDTAALERWIAQLGTARGGT